MNMNQKGNNSVMPNTGTEAIPEGSIPQKATSPSSKPQPARVNDVTILEAPEMDISAVEFEGYDTLPLTLGSQRPILGYKPLGDLPLLQEHNSTEFTLASHVLMEDRDQISVNLVMRGGNVIVPLSLPPVGANDPVDEASLSAAFFLNNGPSIATPGSARRAAVEQSASTMKSVIVKAFNRSIPFTDFGPAQRSFLLAGYEAELLKLQNFWQSLDVLRGYAEYLAEQSIPTDDSWLALYSPDLYTKLIAVYNSCQDFLVYDDISHKRLEKLGRIFCASKRNSYPGTCFMQDVIVAESAFQGDISSAETRADGSTPLQNFSMSQCIPNYSMTQWFAIFLNPAWSDRAISEVASGIKSLRIQYETVITALAQLISKGALAEMRFKDYIPAQPAGAGFMQFADSRPAFSYAAHERFEYAPETLYGEVGSTGTVTTWNINDLPDYASSRKPSECISRRPVGKCHGSEAFKVSEVIDIGLFKNADSAPYRDSMASNRVTTGVRSNLVLNSSTSAQHCSLFVDAVYGDMYIDGVFYREGTTQVTGGYTILHGLSLYPTGSGMHNVLSAPIFYGVSPSSSALPGFHMSVGQGVGFFGGYNAQGISNVGEEDLSKTIGAILFVQWLMENLDVSVFIAPVGNSVAGQREQPLGMMSGYALSGYYTYALTPVDNIVGLKYTELIPEMVINFARK